MYGSDFFLLLFVYVRTHKSMCKLINDRSKIFVLLSRSFFSLLWIFVPIMLLSTQQQSHGLTSDCACMCTHIYPHTMKTLLEIAVYDRLPANSIYDMSTKKEKGGGKRRKINDDSTNSLEYAYVRFFNRSCWYQVFLFLCFNINHQSQNDQTMKKKNKSDLYNNIYTHRLCFTMCIHALKVMTKILPYSSSNRICRQDHNNTF